MCELFAMSSRLPSTVNLSLKTLADHGGGSAPHDDGWGIAYYHGRFARLIKDCHAAYDSDWVKFVESRGLKSKITISHIRQATRGGVSLQNTHPFLRELGGRHHVFAHNGTLKGVQEHSGFNLGHFRPIGETDSERAFCSLLGRMEPLWMAGDEAPSLDDRFAVFKSFAEEARDLGPANFLYSDGDYLFLQANIRHHENGHVGPPGLHALTRQCKGPSETVTGGGVAVTAENQEIILLASVPLTDEDWSPLPENTLLALSGGEVVARA